MDLIERRRVLVEETEELEARRIVVEGELPFPPVPNAKESRKDHDRGKAVGETSTGAAERPLPPTLGTEELHDDHDQNEEDLIDMTTTERGEP